MLIFEVLQVQNETSYYFEGPRRCREINIDFGDYVEVGLLFFSRWKFGDYIQQWEKASRVLASEEAVSAAFVYGMEPRWIHDMNLAIDYASAILVWKVGGEYRAHIGIVPIPKGCNPESSCFYELGKYSIVDEDGDVIGLDWRVSGSPFAFRYQLEN